MKKILIPVLLLAAVGAYAYSKYNDDTAAAITTKTPQQKIAELEGKLVVAVNGNSVLIKNGKLWFNSSQKAVDDYIRINQYQGDFVRNVPNELISLIPVGGYLDVNGKLVNK